jgi:multiple sugar transport system permease protein
MSGNLNPPALTRVAAPPRSLLSRLNPANLRDRTLRWVMIIPALITIICVTIYPLLYSLYMSFFSYNIINPPRFIGLTNYQRILTDDRFWHSVQVTFSFAVPEFILEVTIGFGLALLINRDLKGKNFIRSVILIPLMLTPVVVGLNWRVMFNYDFGIINWIIGQFGIGKIDWVNDVNYALPALVILEVWRVVPFDMLVFSAGLAALPEDPFEAAEMDGASPWQQLRLLTIPMLRPLFVVIAIFRSYELIRVFDPVYTLTGGGPGRATETISFQIFNRLFDGWQVGFASATSYVLFLISLIIVVIILKTLGLGGFETQD